MSEGSPRSQGWSGDVAMHSSAIRLTTGITVLARQWTAPLAGRGPVVLALHGFPENGLTWRPLAHALARHGVRVVSVDQRGHGASDAPRSIREYRLDRLVADVLDVVRQLDEPVHLVGHDWGGAVAWSVAESCPSEVRSITVLAAPHPAVLRQSLRSDPDQRRRSAYMVAAQLPWLAPWWLRRGDHRVMRAWLSATLDPDDMAVYADGWRRPGQVAAMLNWYRALLWFPPPPADRGAATRPVHLITGTNDPLFGDAVLEASVARLAGSSHDRLDGVGHSPHRTAVDEVAIRLAHLTDGS